MEDIMVHRNEVGFYYIFFSDVPEQYKEEFCEWMRGQEGPLIDGRAGIYLSDWERWLNGKIVICTSCQWQGSFDKLNSYKENKTEDLPGGLRQFTDIKEFCPDCGSIFLKSI